MAADDSSPVDTAVLGAALERRIEAISRTHATGMLLSFADAALLIAVARCWRSMILADKRPFGATPAERHNDDVHKHSAAEIMNILESTEQAICDVLDNASPDLRVAVLATLLATEISMLPHSERQDALRKLIADLPEFLNAAEKDMREWLAEQARSGRD